VKKHLSALRQFGAVLVMLAGWTGGLFAQENIEVKGLGFFKDRQMDSRLSFLLGYDSAETASLDATVLEDSAFLLFEQVKRQGFLEPTIRGVFRTSEGERSALWEKNYSVQLPVGMTARHAVFRIEPGQLYYYHSVSIKGVPVLGEKDLREFFIPGGALLTSRANQFYTPENFDRRVQRLLYALEARGYRSASLAEDEVWVEAATGAVSVELRIDPGPLHLVGEVQVAAEESGREIPVEDELIKPGTVFTRDWERYVRQSVLNTVYGQGYPDAEVEMKVLGVRESGEGETGERVHDLRFEVDRGNQVVLTAVRFEGDPGTKRSVLRRQVDLETGERLNRLAVSGGQRRLMGLGIFDDVNVDFEPARGSGRAAVYELHPGQRKELRLRAGWGSYELARVGFDWEHRNPFGRAHRYQLSVKQSIKARSLEFDYLIPRIWGTSAEAYLRAEYNGREEISFDRTSSGIEVGFSDRLAWGWRVGLTYGISRETAERRNVMDFLSRDKATVAAVEVTAALDRRNSPLTPSRGYALHAGYEIANEAFGGSVNFHRIRLGGSFHFPLTESLFFHSGLNAGTVFSSGEASENIPFLERFFQGGADTVRGYREGRASPLNSSGEEIGSESFVLLNLELEQRVWRQIAVVTFLDSVWNARDAFFQSGRNRLYSIGFGLRYHSPVGPIRLEYGRNLNPRPDDSSGQLHFSIGFPF